MKMSRAEYSRMVDALAPKSKTGRNCIAAFLVGGLICTLGQVFMNLYMALDLSKDNASTAAGITLILLSAIFSGFAVYDDIAKFAGAGTLVPITGFANAIASPAVEFKTDECDIIGLSRRASTSGEYDDLVQNHLLRR